MFTALLSLKTTALPTLKIDSDEIFDFCISGFSPQETVPPLEDKYVTVSGASQRNALLREEVLQWMNDHSWQSTYAKWLSHKGDSCQDPEKSYQFLAMHRFLIDSMRSLWPDLTNQFDGWSKFPRDAEDYPKILQDQFYAWSDETLKAGMQINRIGMMTKEELLEYWPSEKDLAHWLECGDEGTNMSVDALYGAMLFNGLGTTQNLFQPSPNHLINTYSFWQTHAWIDRAWKMYQKKTGLMPFDPDLQAELLNQCQIFLGHKDTEQAVNNTNKNDLLFTKGQLNANYKNKIVRLFGEVMNIKTTDQGALLYQVNLKLKGVKPVWVMGAQKINPENISIGKRFVFIGYINNVYPKNKSSDTYSLIHTSTILIAESIQSSK